MGADQSITYLPIYPQFGPICATEPRFCLPYSVQLSVRQIKRRYPFGRHATLPSTLLPDDNFKITDFRNENIVYFHCGNRYLLWRQKTVLRDIADVPVLTMEKIDSHSRSEPFQKFNLMAGEGNDRQIGLFIFKPTFVISKMAAIFPDALCGIQRNLVLKGNWLSKQCAIYLGEPKAGGIPLARIFRPTEVRSVYSELGLDGYIIEIAARVDVAICVMMCIATDEAMINKYL